MMAVVSSMLVERTERGDEMFLTMLERHSSHVLDTGALDILPAVPDTRRWYPTRPTRARTSRATSRCGTRAGTGTSPIPEQGIGGWIRLGLVPNQKVAWINALVCGPDMPTVALLDFEAPLPADPGDGPTGDGIEIAPRRNDPLQSYRVEVQRHRRRPTTIPPRCCAASRAARPNSAMDLTWTTDGHAVRSTGSPPATRSPAP